MFQRIVLPRCSGLKLCFACHFCLLGLLFPFEDGGSKFLQNISNIHEDSTASHLIRQNFVLLLPWEPHSQHRCYLFGKISVFTSYKLRVKLIFSWWLWGMLARLTILGYWEILLFLRSIWDQMRMYSALESLYHVGVDSVANISDIHAVFIFRTEVRAVSECSCIQWDPHIMSLSFRFSLI
jgi:hypothetical protein